ncbi:glutaredoxin-C9-like [Bidens hawaiensis]|uniref:glutaredoxin-C9-like n=1 Tax=Bidens hawaiensis TaxID=980011 RepID=UPI0040495343
MTTNESTSVVVDRTTGVAKMEAKLEAVYERVHHLANGNAVVVFSVSGCCMGHVAKQLLFGLGVGPTVVELDKEAAGMEIHALLSRLAAGKEQHQPVPAVFIGGKFLGGIETLIACHINGTLVPLLKEAGALWL